MGVGGVLPGRFKRFKRFLLQGVGDDQMSKGVGILAWPARRDSCYDWTWLTAGPEVEASSKTQLRGAGPTFGQGESRRPAKVWHRGA